MKNPFEGKKVIFVENDEEPMNADGARGHLEIIGSSEHKAKIYEKFIKRGLDIVLAFTGLVVVSPILLFVSIAIFIDDPGPAFFTQNRIGKNKRFFLANKFLTTPRAA